MCLVGAEYPRVGQLQRDFDVRNMVSWVRACPEGFEVVGFATGDGVPPHLAYETFLNRRDELVRASLDLRDLSTRIIAEHPTDRIETWKTLPGPPPSLRRGVMLQVEAADGRMAGLSQDDVRVVVGLLRRRSSAAIGGAMARSRRTIESRVDSLKQRLAVASIGDLIELLSCNPHAASLLGASMAPHGLVRNASPRGSDGAS